MASGESLLAACGGDTVKLFDVSVETGDPCSFHYTPTPGCQVNCAKWNHTNLVVASAGDDRKISLWMKNGQSIGAVPQSGNDAGDHVDESILAICFSSKGSRYLCSGGTGKVVRVWDLQRKRCIKWLKGHTDTITGVMYNCKDEHLASISLKGDLILHNLASGARAAELKDPNEQVLRVLDYSRASRHILVTAGDDGSVHIWDTTGRSPKVSWVKQHSAPTTGVCFSPSNDKMVVSVGLDKKLYTFDPGMKKPVFCVPCEAPFSSLAFKDDGLILAAGTNSGRVVFYDVRGKPQPFTILRAYSTSEAVTSLCWQRSKPILVNETNCSLEAALLGGAGEDSILMPDPLPASTSLSHGSASLTTAPARSSGRLAFGTADSSPISVSGISVASAAARTSPGEDNLGGNHLWTNGTMSRLQTRNNFSFKDDMEVFSPLVDVQPITPSVASYWDNRDDLKKEGGLGDNSRKVAWNPSPPSAIRRFPSIEELSSESYLNFDRRSISTQEDSQGRVSSPSQLATPPAISLKGDRSPSVTPPEAWGGDIPTDRFNLRQQSSHNMSRFATSVSLDSSGLLSGTVSSFSHGTLSSSTSGTADYSASINFSASQLTGIDFSNLENSGASETLPVLTVNASSLGSKHGTGQTNAELSTSIPMGLPRKYMAYVDRKANANMSRGVSFPGDGPLSNASSPKQKKTGTERKDEKIGPDATLDGKRDLENGPFLRSDIALTTVASSTPVNGNSQLNSQRSLSQPDYNQQGPPSFALQLVQRTLEESLGSVQRAIHEDVQNLHLELLRQFHIQQTEMGTLMNSVLEKQSDLMKEVQALRRENEQLRQLL